jgi:hypothetical protein
MTGIAGRRCAVRLEAAPGRHRSHRGRYRFDDGPDTSRSLADLHARLRAEQVLP